MRQYLTLLEEIKKRGTLKPAARAGMPGTLSLFGYQFRHDLAEGFPLLTTKKMSWKSVVTELLWFLRGDTNIKYLVDNGCNFWNEDAYNYYKKIGRKHNIPESDDLSFEQFIEEVKDGRTISLFDDYSKMGDCGYQYGRVWRDWEGHKHTQEYDFGDELGNKYLTDKYEPFKIDQIANVIKSLKETPESRRHIVTAWDPTHDKDLALTWCHAMFQFNCRPLTLRQRVDYINTPEIQGRSTPYLYMTGGDPSYQRGYDIHVEKDLDIMNVPKYYLDCQLYQRSADVVLGVPFNIASYALLTHIIAKIVNMIPGEFIHTFGDVHIYENHFDAVEEQLTREPRLLPELVHMKTDAFWNSFDIQNITHLDYGDFLLENYNPHPKIEAKLSTGLK